MPLIKSPHQKLRWLRGPDLESELLYFAIYMHICIGLIYAYNIASYANASLYPDKIYVQASSSPFR